MIFGRRSGFLLKWSLFRGHLLVLEIHTPISFLAWRLRKVCFDSHFLTAANPPAHPSTPPRIGIPAKKSVLQRAPKSSKNYVQLANLMRCLANLGQSIFEKIFETTI